MEFKNIFLLSKKTYQLTYKYLLSKERSFDAVFRYSLSTVNLCTIGVNNLPFLTFYKFAQNARIKRFHPHYLKINIVKTFIFWLNFIITFPAIEHHIQLVIIPIYILQSSKVNVLRWDTHIVITWHTDLTRFI